MKKIVDLYQKIIRRNRTEFDPERTKLFGELIPLIKEGDTSMTNNSLSKKIDAVKLRKVFSIEQMSIEKYWSQKIISSENPLAEITKFPFYRGYVSTTSYLYNSITSISNKHIKKILYIGAGALPLNSTLIAQNHNLKVDNIEREDKSFKLSKLLMHSLKLDKQIKVIHKDIFDFKKLKNYDVIICAILVGSNTKQRQRVINHISRHMKFGNLLLLKNVDGLRTLLYPPIDITRFSKSLHVEDIHKKQTELTNILIVAKKISKDDKNFGENN